MNLVYALFLLYILLPKIDLISLSGSAVRASDLIYLLSIGLYLEIRGFRMPRIPLVQNYLIFVGVAFVSLVLNGGLEYPFAILNVFRLLQYVSWAFIGYEIAAGKYVTPARFSRDMRSIVFFLFAWAALEAAHLIPKMGKFTGASERVTVNTSGPFEIAMVAAFFCFTAEGRLARALAFVITLLSQARITIAATFLISLRKYWKVIAVFFAIALPVASLVPWSSFLVGTRFAETPKASELLNALQFYWSHAKAAFPSYATGSGFELLQVQSETTDMSFELRALRWTSTLATTFSTTKSEWIGFGPGSWGVALDGYYVRLIGEFGIIGFVAFMWFAIRGVFDRTINYSCKNYLLCLIATAVFIDIFVTDKPMSLLWFYVGFCFQSPHSKALVARTKPTSERGHIWGRGKSGEL